jgi:GTP-binding protein LepA
LTSADVEKTRTEIGRCIGIDALKSPAISAKEGINIKDVLDMIVDHIPAPKGDEDKPLKALIFDSIYDNFKGAICFIRVFDGSVKIGTKIQMMSTGNVYDITEVGYFSPKMNTTQELKAGDVGYICASIKNITETKVG